jgi:transketolase
LRKYYKITKYNVLRGLMMSVLANLSFKQALSKTFKKLGEEKKDLVFITSDVGKSVNAEKFKDIYSERFVNVGIAEQNAVGIASGFASVGFDVIFFAYAMFAAGRAWEIIRNYVCYPNLNVKIIASHGGLNVGEDGVTHQATEDIAIMRVLPNMKVLVVEEPNQVYGAISKALSVKGPVYVRVGRADNGNITQSIKWDFGKSETLRVGKDATIIAVGLMVKHAMEAAESLSKKGIECRVINMRSVKPIDNRAILDAANETGLIVTAEEHNIIGGLFSAVTESLAMCGCSARVVPIALNDCFAESGNGFELMSKYGLSAIAIENAVFQNK